MAGALIDALHRDDFEAVDLLACVLEESALSFEHNGIPFCQAVPASLRSQFGNLNGQRLLQAEIGLTTQEARQHDAARPSPAATRRCLTVVRAALYGVLLSREAKAARTRIAAMLDALDTHLPDPRKILPLADAIMDWALLIAGRSPSCVDAVSRWTSIELAHLRADRLVRMRPAIARIELVLGYEHAHHTSRGDCMRIVRDRLELEIARRVRLAAREEMARIVAAAVATGDLATDWSAELAVHEMFHDLHDCASRLFCEFGLDQDTTRSERASLERFLVAETLAVCLPTSGPMVASLKSLIASPPYLEMRKWKECASGDGSLATSAALVTQATAMQAAIAESAIRRKRESSPASRRTQRHESVRTHAGQSVAADDSDGCPRHNLYWRFR